MLAMLRHLLWCCHELLLLLVLLRFSVAWMLLVVGVVLIGLLRGVLVVLWMLFMIRGLGMLGWLSGVLLSRSVVSMVLRRIHLGSCVLLLLLPLLGRLHEVCSIRLRHLRGIRLLVIIESLRWLLGVKICLLAIVTVILSLSWVGWVLLLIWICLWGQRRLLHLLEVLPIVLSHSLLLPFQIFAFLLRILPEHHDFEQ
jgi:hypothetical protein